MSFLHHLVSFSCNCNQESDNWACASDCPQSKGHRGHLTWQTLHQDYLKSNFLRNSSFISFNAHHKLPFTFLLMRWLEILLCCRPGHRGPAWVTDGILFTRYFDCCFSVASALVSMPRWPLQECSVRWKSLPCVALQVQLWWVDKASHVSQITANLQSSTTSLWGTAYG